MDRKGRTVYTNYAGLAFGPGDDLTQTVTVKGIPILLDHVTVTEVYAGAYAKAGPVTAEYNEASGLWEVTLQNTGNDTFGPGSGVVNKYESGGFREQQSAAPKTAR